MEAWIAAEAERIAAQAPEQLARLVGLDLTDPGMWSEGLAGIEELLSEAEGLAQQLLAE